MSVCQEEVRISFGRGGLRLRTGGKAWCWAENGGVDELWSSTKGQTNNDELRCRFSSSFRNALDIVGIELGLKYDIVGEWISN